MRWLSVLLSLALVATLLALVGGHADAAKPRRKPGKQATEVTLRLAPDRVTVYPNGVVEPTGLVVQVTPARAGRVITFQEQVGTGWRTVAQVRTDTTGRAYRPLPSPTTVGAWTYRAAVSGNDNFKPAISATRKLRATSNGNCQPAHAPATAANGEAVCLLARLDTWQRNRLMGVGQQVNVSDKDSWAAPLAGIRPSIVGFDLQELDAAATAEYPYVDQQVQGLLDRAKAGAVLVASWHATNPVTGEPYGSKPINLDRVTTPGTAVYDRFWADWDTKLDLLKRFQEGDSDGNGDNGAIDGERTAVVVRPLHEVNGDFFWWGKPKPATYRKVWSMMQSAAAAKGVTNIVWAYSGNRKTSTTTDPGLYVPANVDIGGLDAYDPETGKGNAADVQPLEGYAAIAKKSTRMALTEVGPHTSNGDWNPTVVQRTVVKARLSPLWAMLWFDDTGYAQAGTKQITSLKGGKAWLASCFNALCYLR